MAGERETKSINGVQECTITYYSRDANGKIMAIYEMYRENILDAGWYQWNQPDKPVPGDNINTAVASLDNIFSTHANSESEPNIIWDLPEGDDLDDLMDWLNGGGAPRMPSLSEWHIYGSGSHGRFCIRQSPITVYYLNPQIQLYSDIEERRLRFKNYELKDHLGNVRVVFTDLKLSNVFDPLSDYYLFNDNDTPRATKKPFDAEKPFDADLVAISNYYPFGMLQPGLFYSGESYRFGFNGMEKDDKLKGEGNSLDFGARMYDSRVGRFLSLDPRRNEFASSSPFAYGFDNPIFIIDEGGEGGDIWYDVTTFSGRVTNFIVFGQYKTDGERAYLRKQHEYDSEVNRMKNSEKNMSQIIPGYTPMSDYQIYQKSSESTAYYPTGSNPQLSQAELSPILEIEEYLESSSNSPQEEVGKFIANTIYSIFNEPSKALTGETLGGTSVGAIERNDASVNTISTLLPIGIRGVKSTNVVKTVSTNIINKLSSSPRYVSLNQFRNARKGTFNFFNYGNGYKRAEADAWRIYNKLEKATSDATRATVGTKQIMKLEDKIKNDNINK